MTEENAEEWEDPSESATDHELWVGLLFLVGPVLLVTSAPGVVAMWNGTISSAYAVAGTATIFLGGALMLVGCGYHVRAGEEADQK